jgi:hypothetical protein
MLNAVQWLVGTPALPVVYVKGNFVVVSERRGAPVFAGYARQVV